RLWRFGRLTDRDVSGKFWVVQDGRRVLTMTAACVLSVVLIDIAFAIESIAVVSVSKTTFIVVTSNILAAITVRSWFVMLDTVKPLHAPRKAIALLFGVVGLKLVTHSFWDVP